MQSPDGSTQTNEYPFFSHLQYLLLKEISFKITAGKRDKHFIFQGEKVMSYTTISLNEMNRSQKAKVLKNKHFEPRGPKILFPHV
jgi:hypothetical protein